ncbi:hypothetical protein FKM82_011572 [Ascaphus truei]
MAAPMERLSGVCADLERWVRGQLEQGEPRGGVEVVQRLSELLREQVYREMTEERIFKLILQILSKASREIQTVGAGTVIPLEKWLQLVAECFRCLRNSCVQCPQNQCVIRYLIVTDRFLKCPELVKAMYAKLSNQERITMLELIMATISEKDPLSEEESSSLQKIAEILAGFFQEQCKAVLRLASADDDEEALVVIRLLDVLCEMTSNNEHLVCLQNIPCLLDTVVEILRLTHLAGKQSKNVFTAVHTMTLGEDLKHVAVGFKAHLIRIIGNLCYKNKENQDKIFQLEGIPLILDNCSIDDNNPFLNQWAMFAIRNLTEHNKRNQELIAQMERQGLADSSLLNSMGFQVEDRDGKLLLKSTKK